VGNIQHCSSNPQKNIDYLINGGDKLPTDGVHMNNGGDLLIAKIWIESLFPTFSKL